jgi:phosphohistidine phosphatase
MKTLLLMRHAKSSWNHPELADHDRPLNKRGKRDAPAMGEYVAEQELVPDLVISSTAVRARKTAEKVARAFGEKIEPVLFPELYHAEPPNYESVLCGLSDQYSRVLLVSHNPGIEEILALLAGVDEAVPTATVAWIELPIESWGQFSVDVQGELITVWKPHELFEDVD